MGFIEETKARIQKRLDMDAKRLPLLVAEWQAEKLPLARAARRDELRNLCVGNQQDRVKMKRWEAMG